MPSGIYKIVCLPTGRAYVGCATLLNKRRNKHFSELRRGIHHSPKLQRAWDKYGEDAFSFEVIELVPDAPRLLEREQFWIDALSAAVHGFNVCAVAGRVDGRTHDAETRAKISAARRAAYEKAGGGMPEETRAKVSAAVRAHLEANGSGNLGKKRSPETIEKMRQVSRDRWTTELRAEWAARSSEQKHSEGTRAKRSASLKAYLGGLTPEQKAQRVAAMREKKPKVISDETRAKMSAASKERAARGTSQETRDKIAAAVTGRKHSDESRARMAEVKREYWRRRKEAEAKAAGAAAHEG